MMMVEEIMASEEDNQDEGGLGISVISKTAPQTKKPSMYKVLLLNDDFTPQEFVVWLLQAVFKKNSEDAYRIMLHVHQKGVGICGIYTREIAESKVEQVIAYAKQNEHPLQCTMEPDSDSDDE